MSYTPRNALAQQEPKRTANAACDSILGCRGLSDQLKRLCEQLVLLSIPPGRRASGVLGGAGAGAVCYCWVMCNNQYHTMLGS